MISQRSRAATARRRVPIVLVAMSCLLVSLFAPLLNAAAAALPNVQATTAPTQPSIEQPTQPPIQQPTQPPTAPPTQPPVAPPTQVPTQPAQNTGTITIFKYDCGVGYDPTKQGANPVQDCQQAQNGVQFNLAGQNSGYTSQTNTGDSQPGAVMFGGIPFDTYTVVETVPQGYGAPLVFCGTDNTAVQQQQLQQISVSNGNQVSLQLQTPFLMCGWYNIPTGGAPTATATAQAPTATTQAGTPGANAHNLPPGSGASLAVELHLCPDYDPATMPNPGYQDLATNCTGHQGGVVFHVTANGQQQPPVQTQGGNISAWRLDGLPPGDGAVVVEPPSGYGSSIVYCGVDNPASGQQFSYQNTPSYYGTTIHTTLVDAATTACQWFLLPPATFYINKHGCTGGFDPNTVTPNELAQNCNKLMPGVRFTFTKSGGQTASGLTANSGLSDITAEGLAAPVDLKVQEDVPNGYQAPIVYCKTRNPTTGASGPLQKMDVTGGNTITYPLKPAQHISCDWFNIPASNSTVTIHKWQCPKDYDPTKQGANPKNDCTQPESGIDFTLTDSASTAKMTTANGQAAWPTVRPGPITISETIPNGYGVPFVTCQELNATVGPMQVVQAPNGVYKTILASDHSILCDWYNIPKSPGQIIIDKWTCPAGYDLYAGGADPKNDCKQATNGIQFNLAGQNTGYTSQTNTGDSQPGAVMFGGIQPDTYTVTETVPAGTAMVFVGDCTGNTNPAVHPFPLATGKALKIDVGGGDKIVCNWYNVPQVKGGGTLTVHKQACSTPTFVSTLDCQTFEGGQGFNLLGWNGSQWVVVSTGTTNNLGVLSWTGLNPGTYQLQEKGRTPCSITSPGLEKGGGLAVAAGQETVVWVYNCNIKSTPQPPTKYPNTGVGPVDGGAGGGPGSGLPVLFGLLGLALLAAGALFGGRFRSVRMPAVRLPQRGLAILLAGSIVTSTLALSLAPVAAQPTIVAPSTCAPAPAKLPKNATKTEKANAQAGAASGTVAAALDPRCNEVPVAITIPAAKVDAKIEVLEIVDGVMQAPTAADVVSWYKESPRLGQPGNMLLAGHLNYWGVPEGVFFYLNTLKKGDTIQITGQGGEIYTYKVEWNRMEDATKPPTNDVVGTTTTPSLTLITCGGTWIPSASEYDQRTVVRANFVSVQKPKK